MTEVKKVTYYSSRKIWELYHRDEHSTQIKEIQAQEAHKLLCDYEHNYWKVDQGGVHVYTLLTA